jgi:hypothetical protein
MTALEQLRTIYFNATQSTIADDFGRAIDLFKQLTTDEDREKAAVFMEGIAEMRREWGADTRGGGKGPRARSIGKGGAAPGARKRPGGAPGGTPPKRR